MPAAVRIGDLCTGHGPYGPRPAISGSENVFINSISAHRVGDLWTEHCHHGCHGSVQATGAPTVRVNGIPLARVGDQIACGSINAQGSPNVFAGSGNPIDSGYTGEEYMSDNYGSNSTIQPQY